MIRRRNKYNARKVTVGRRKFASRAESDLHTLLRLREAAGEIRELKCQDNVYLTEARILYIADFRFIECERPGEIHSYGQPPTYAWAEYKGMETDVWRLKRRLWLAGYGPGKLYVYKGRGKAIRLHEVLNPSTREV